MEKIIAPFQVQVPESLKYIENNGGKFPKSMQNMVK
jgi:hypothetical protein